MIKTRCFDGIIPFSFPPKISEIPSLVLNKNRLVFSSFFVIFLRIMLEVELWGISRVKGMGNFVGI